MLSSLARSGAQRSFIVLASRVFALKPRWAGGRFNGSVVKLKRAWPASLSRSKAPQPRWGLCWEWGMCLRNSQDFLKELLLELGQRELGLR